eukprot:SAG31_NODE_4672_length_3044_cov_3.919525_3_plen_122_part_00
MHRLSQAQSSHSCRKQREKLQEEEAATDVVNGWQAEQQENEEESFSNPLAANKPGRTAAPANGGVEDRAPKASSYSSDWLESDIAVAAEYLRQLLAKSGGTDDRLRKALAIMEQPGPTVGT